MNKLCLLLCTFLLIGCAISEKPDEKEKLLIGCWQFYKDENLDGSTIERIVIGNDDYEKNFSLCFSEKKVVVKNNSISTVVYYKLKNNNLYYGNRECVIEYLNKDTLVMTSKVADILSLMDFSVRQYFVKKDND